MGPSFEVDGSEHLMQRAEWELHLKAWYFKTYMDANEYGFDLQVMVSLNDFPRNTQYMDGVFAAADGRPSMRENMMCIFESYTDDIAW
ncbi:hypothetical protein Cni_G22576 [Canna indica]|uniref:Amine oxidase n=1 Tax=Canna indica TaxID=4628 RepID=A0AAQ3KRH5_9LILI|nr:hypothetical protein Cni_G22576 [Canna indica]